MLAITNLISFIVGLVRKPFLSQAQDKRVIYHGRLGIQKFRRYSLRRPRGRMFGPPVLTGARLARMTEACDPKHLLVLPRYLRTA